MKKIMFNDRFGLTDAVIAGAKTMTRRIVPEKIVKEANAYVQQIHGSGLDMLDYFLAHSHYKVNEIVAVAQPYKDVIYTGGLPHPLVGKSGWTNKMFVRADLMPHQILITDCHCEPLQDISDGDCLREGISFVNGHFYIGYRKTTGQYIWLDGDTPREAFATLINKTSGKHTWDDNPYVYVYSFKLVK